MNWPNLDPVLAPLHWAVWGGVALRLYLPNHVASDLDIAVAAADSAAVQQKMIVAGYIYAGQSDWGEAQWRDQSGTVIDITLGAEEWWPLALAEAQSNRDAQGWPILPLPYQILLKLDDSRPKIAAQMPRLLAIADSPTLAEVRRLVARYRPQKVAVVEEMMEGIIIGLQAWLD